MSQKLISLGNLSTFKDHVEEKSVVLTAEQYAALTPAQKNADISYYVYDDNVVPTISNTIFTLRQTLTAGSTTLTFTDVRLTADSLIQIFYPNSNTDIDYMNFEQLSATSFRLTFDAQESNVMVVALVINA